METDQIARLVAQGADENRYGKRLKRSVRVQSPAAARTRSTQVRRPDAGVKWASSVSPKKVVDRYYGQLRGVRGVGRH